MCVDLRRELVNDLGQLSVGMQLKLTGDEVVVCFGLLERGLPVLSDHHEGRQEDGLKGDDERQGRPWTLLKHKHPHGEEHAVQVHESHRPGEGQ